MININDFSKMKIETKFFKIVNFINAKEVIKEKDGQLSVIFVIREVHEDGLKIIC